MDDRITPKAPYGRHIDLTCVNHPELEWSTKNISPIGARSIFFESSAPECNCPCSALRAIPIEGPDVEE